MGSAYVDTVALTQVIGCVFNEITLLDNTDQYIIHEDDFTEDFQKILFGSMYNIHLTGSAVNLESIVDYLAVRPKSNAIFEANKGIKFLQKISELAQPDTFNYYYHRMKKMSLLRAYDNIGLDVSFLYDPNELFDTKRRQEQEDWLDSTSLEDIALIIDKRIDDVKSKYVEESFSTGYQAGEGIDELIDEYLQRPEVGIPLYGSLINTVTRGARLRKFYLRSGATGTGKTRTMAADACNFACNEIYHNQFGWIRNGSQEPTLFISTELDKGEVQTMMLAFLSEVNEEHILNGRYEQDEYDRVCKAKEVLKNSPLWIEELPDFSIKDVEDRIKKYIREHDVKYVFFDYIHSSMKILEEISKRSGGIRLREDNVLFILSTKLKDMCNQYGIFIMSGTQLSGDYRNDEEPDQNLLRGAKSIADRIDVGMILLSVTNEDIQKLQSVLGGGGFAVPNIKISIYKNRRGRWKGVYLWCNADLGTCRVQPMFCTNFRYELQPIEDMRITVEEDGAW